MDRCIIGIDCRLFGIDRQGGESDRWGSEGIGLDPLGITPEELGRFVREESEKYGRTIKAAGIKLD